MAGVLKYRLFRVSPGDFRGPRFGPCTWIVEGDLVGNVIRGCARNALDHVELVTVVHDGSLPVVGRIDYQCVAFPMAPRVTMPQLDVRGRMRAPIDRNNTRVVNLLHHDGNRFG